MELGSARCRADARDTRPGDPSIVKVLARGLPRGLSLPLEGVAGSEISVHVYNEDKPDQVIRGTSTAAMLVDSGDVKSGEFAGKDRFTGGVELDDPTSLWVAPIEHDHPYLHCSFSTGVPRPFSHNPDEWQPRWPIQHQLSNLRGGMWHRDRS